MGCIINDVYINLILYIIFWNELKQYHKSLKQEPAHNVRHTAHASSTVVIINSN